MSSRRRFAVGRLASDTKWCFVSLALTVAADGLAKKADEVRTWENSSCLKLREYFGGVKNVSVIEDLADFCDSLIKYFFLFLLAFVAWRVAWMWLEPRAQFKLGELYENGHVVQQDYAQARHWYEKAAEQGYAAAQYKLGMLLYMKEGLRDSKQARQVRSWFEKAAKQGNADAQFLLATMYLVTQQTQQDYARAVDLLEKAVAQGHAAAQRALGNLYLYGEGVPQNYEKARNLLEKSAAQGLGTAQYDLAMMYFIGLGARQDRRAAKELFGKACDAGTQEGCDRYGELNDLGF